jgi:hypothetical protein
MVTMAAKWNGGELYVPGRLCYPRIWGEKRKKVGENMFPFCNFVLREAGKDEAQGGSSPVSPVLTNPVEETLGNITFKGDKLEVFLRTAPS